jgi:MerR family transcriptional regulator, heat shock protein HspR
MAPRPEGRDPAMYVISIAAELAGVHPQTLRVYERKGLVNPHRTEGNTRRYSAGDIARLRRIQELTQDGINLAGVMRILELERETDGLRTRLETALQEIDNLTQQVQEAMGARDRSSLVPLRDVRRVRRAMKADFVEQAGRRRTFAVPPIRNEEAR